MKTTKYIITLLTLFYAVSASAQFMSAPTTTETTTSSSQTKQPKTKRAESSEASTSSVYISLDIPTLIDTEDSAYSQGYLGFTVGYDYCIPINQVPNLSVNAGAAMSYARHASEVSFGDFAYEEYTSNNMSVSIPTSVSYSLNLRDNFSVVPYFGFIFRYGLVFNGKTTSEYTYDDGYGGTEVSYSEDKYYLYSPASVGSNDYSYCRFNFAYQIGFNVDFNKYFAGIGYARDLSKTSEDLVYGNFSIRVGLKF